MSRPPAPSRTLRLLDPLAEIKHLYYRTTRATIERDFAQALDLLKSMANEEERERATVYMQGLAEMRADWRRGPKRTDRRRSKR